MSIATTFARSSSDRRAIAAASASIIPDCPSRVPKPSNLEPQPLPTTHRRPDNSLRAFTLGRSSPPKSFRSMAYFKIIQLESDLDFEQLPYWDVVIIGAGPAALAASLTTAHRALTTLVIEAKDRPGGQP